MDNKGAVIRLQMDETLAGLSGKLGELEGQVSETVRTVKDSVDTVRDSLDLKLQVRQRPWTLMAGAMVLGFIGGHRSNNHATRNGRSASVPLPRESAAEGPHSGANDGTIGDDGARRAPAALPSWLENLGNTFQPEIAELKGIVIGTLIGIAREIITNQLPRPSERTAGVPNNGKLDNNHRTVLDDE